MDSFDGPEDQVGRLIGGAFPISEYEVSIWTCWFPDKTSKLKDDIPDWSMIAVPETSAFVDVRPVCKMLREADAGKTKPTDC